MIEVVSRTEISLERALSSRRTADDGKSERSDRRVSRIKKNGFYIVRDGVKITMHEVER